ncbi:MAG TPA: polysaccharide biosynthesis/export family protein [Vicinamibacterales bacterium]|nr:polysaccharide biosynthesis/export family protein [Vicinamibacterales bacterium]
MPITFRRRLVAASVTCGLGLLAATAAAQTPRSIAPPPRAVVQPPPTSAPPPATATADRTRPTQTALPDDYRLQVGDKLRIEVYKDAQLSQSVQIRPDGKITLPLVGDIAAMGITPIDLRERVATALKDYVNNPVVTVIVVEGTAPTAYVVGEVNHPGAVTLQSRMTVLQALAMAGGLKDFADAKNIRILRKGVTGEQSILFNYKDAIKGVGPSAVFLQAGDTVVVPD